MVNVNVLNMVGVVILLLQASAFASVENVREEMDEPFPHVCDTTRSGWNQTRCAANHTCCGSKYSGSLMGCCPYPNAVCCSNKLTCCPDNHECVDYRAPGYPGWGVVTTCVPKSTSSRDVSFSTKAATITSEGPQAMTNSTGVCVCKPGPSLPMDPTRKNVVVIGDSVSIGYTPFVAEVLAKKALVQHSPWGGDGGAEETAYGLQCIDYFTRSPSGERVTPDVIMFNWCVVCCQKAKPCNNFLFYRPSLLFVHNSYSCVRFNLAGGFMMARSYPTAFPQMSPSLAKRVI